MAKKEGKSSNKAAKLEQTNSDSKTAKKVGSPYRELDPKSQKEIAMDFAVKIQKKFDRIVKASVLFGSQAKETADSGSDIDLLLIIDDASVNWDLELSAWYREELSKLISSMNLNDLDLHVNSVKLTTWWKDLMYGDPVAINILRYGEVLIDYGGFFAPLKALLRDGKIRSTPEAVYAALQRAPTHLARSKTAILSSIEGVYWCMIDAAQAGLMMAGKLPPSPEHVPQMLKETFVDSGMLKMDYVTSMKNIYALHKGISHGEVYEVKGMHIDEWQTSAENFLKEMSRIIDTLLEAKK